MLSLIWRQSGSVREAVRTLNNSGYFGVPPLKVSQQAASKRMRIFPAELFRQTLLDVLLLMQDWPPTPTRYRSAQTTNSCRHPPRCNAELPHQDICCPTDPNYRGTPMLTWFRIDGAVNGRTGRGSSAGRARQFTQRSNRFGIRVGRSSPAVRIWPRNTPLYLPWS